MEGNWQMGKIEKVARALATLEGENADEIIQGAWDVDVDPDMHFKGKPRWMKYEQEARRFVVVASALDLFGTEQSGGELNAA